VSFYDAGDSLLGSIAVETCRACGGSAKVITCIENPVIIRKILNHLQEKSSLDLGVRIHNPRAPPQASLFSQFS
jgi:hypothetical protein